MNLATWTDVKEFLPWLQTHEIPDKILQKLSNSTWNNIGKPLHDRNKEGIKVIWTGAEADTILMSTKLWNHDHIWQRDQEEPGNYPQDAALASKRLLTPWLRCYVQVDTNSTILMKQLHKIQNWCNTWIS